PSMRYVGVKTPEQQASSALHRLREARIADRVQTANQIHALLLEFGIVLPLGARGIKQAPDIVMNASADLPHAARRILSAQYEHYRYLAELIAGLD
nr:transposase [Aeromonas salmonicida]